MSNKITSFFISSGTISKSDSEVYAYCFEVVLSTALSLSALALIAIFSGTFSETMLFLSGFVPLRMIAGGYHAKSHLRCFMLMITAHISFILLMLNIPDAHRIMIIFIGVSLSTLSVFLCAPSEDINNPLDKEKVVRLKRKSRRVIVGYVAVICLLVVFVPDKRFAFALSLGILTASTSLMANFVRFKHSQIRDIKAERREKDEEI